MESVLRRWLARFGDAYLAARLVLGGVGRDYGIGRLAKLRLVVRIVRTQGRVSALTTLQQHLVLVNEILAIPASLPGDVVECGCYEGGSSVILSLACALTGRTLFVCDSFEGLPPPRHDEAHEIHGNSPTYYLWEEGEFRSEGGLEGVRRTIEKLGRIEVCRFVEGFFADSLPRLESHSILLIFEDADLPKPVRDCILHLWGKLQDGCKLYCHEPWSIRVVGLFYDNEWWNRNFHVDPPGFHGSGGGVPFGFRASAMGYARKFDAEAVKRSGRKIVHPGSKGFVDPQRPSD